MKIFNKICKILNYISKYLIYDSIKIIKINLKYFKISQYLIFHYHHSQIIQKLLKFHHAKNYYLLISSLFKTL